MQTDDAKLPSEGHEKFESWQFLNPTNQWGGKVWSWWRWARWERANAPRYHELSWRRPRPGSGWYAWARVGQRYRWSQGDKWWRSGGQRIPISSPFPWITKSSSLRANSHGEPSPKEFQQRTWSSTNVGHGLVNEKGSNTAQHQREAVDRAQEANP